MKRLSLVTALLLAPSLLVLSPTEARASGAIAVNDEAGMHPDDVGYGIATGRATREQAASDALHLCLGSGNDSCTVVARFDQCGAYAVSHDHYGVGWGSGESAARAMALRECGGGSCRVVAAECE